MSKNTLPFCELSYCFFRPAEFLNAAVPCAQWNKCIILSLLTIYYFTQGIIRLLSVHAISASKQRTRITS